MISQGYGIAPSATTCVRRMARGRVKPMTHGSGAPNNAVSEEERSGPKKLKTLRFDRRTEG
jgi:hypothetical protein